MQPFQSSCRWESTFSGYNYPLATRGLFVQNENMTINHIYSSVTIYILQYFPKSLAQIQICVGRICDVGHKNTHS